MYENRIYLVVKSDQYEPKFDKRWAQVKAMFNLGHVFDDDDLTNKYKTTDCFIYDDTGNEEILEDKYGNELIEIPIEDMIYELEFALKNELDSRFESNYRGSINFCAYSLLAGLKDLKYHVNSYTYSRMVCLHYGF